MANKPQRIQRILHPTDFSPGSDMAFCHALRFAVNGKCDLTIVHMTNDPSDQGWRSFPRVRQTLERWQLLPAGSPREAIAELGVNVRKLSVCSSDTKKSLLKLVAADPYDLIVLMTHQYDGFNRWTHTLVAEPLARNSAVLTLFVSGKSEGFVSAGNGDLSLSSVLVPVNRFPDPQLAIDAVVMLTDLVGCSNAEATLLYVGDKTHAPKVCTPNTSGLKWRWMFREGDVDEEILRAADDYHADLIVMATAGHQSLGDALRGDTTERIVRHARCPILAVPLPGPEPAVSLAASVATGKLTFCI